MFSKPARNSAIRGHSKIRSCIRWLFGDSPLMKHINLVLTACLIAAPLVLVAQSSQFAPAPFSSSTAASGFVADDATLDGEGVQAASPMGGTPRSYGGGNGLFSHIGFGAGISPLGVQLQADTSVLAHLNIRATGNFFNYNTNFSSNGISATGKLNLASAGVSADFYPFHSGFRLSPGVLLYNQNQVTANANVPAGSSFTLNNTTYYSAYANPATGATPITGSGVLALNATKPAFTVTAGFGNTARGSGHWAFPVDVGVAFIGAPTVKVNLAGWACYDAAETDCANIADTSNPIGQSVQSNLATQEAKWTSDLNPLKTYPILSAGVTYSFHLR